MLEMWRFVIEMFALMEVCFIVFLHIANRAAYIENICWYLLDTADRKSKFREKMVESMNNTDTSDERA